jgi:hypothetical protein
MFSAALDQSAPVIALQARHPIRLSFFLAITSYLHTPLEWMTDGSFY